MASYQTIGGGEHDDVVRRPVMPPWSLSARIAASLGARGLVLLALARHWV